MDNVVRNPKKCGILRSGGNNVRDDAVIDKSKNQTPAPNNIIRTRNVAKSRLSVHVARRGETSEIRAEIRADLTT